MIRQDFKQGDIIVATSHRDALSCDINDLMWICKFDRDIDLQEAKKRHLENMNRNFPGLKITMSDIDEAFKDNDTRYFLNTAGDVLSYENHELADVFDIRYLNGEDLDSLVIEKDQWIRNNNIQRDPDNYFRCYDGLENIDTSRISVEPFDVEMRRLGI